MSCIHTLFELLLNINQASAVEASAAEASFVEVPAAEAGCDFMIAKKGCLIINCETPLSFAICFI